MGWLTGWTKGYDAPAAGAVDRLDLTPAAPQVAVKSANFTNEVIQTVRTLGHAGWYYAGDYGMLYRRQPAVRAVVDLLARNIAQLNLKVYDKVGADDRIELSTHPLALLYRRPNPLTTRYRHMRDTVSDMAIYDVAYWRKLRAGGRIAVVRVPPSKICPEYDQRTGRTVYRLNDGTLLARSDLVIFPGYSPDGDSDGVSPLETLRRVLAEEAAGQQHRENMWRNSARQGGVIERPIEAPEWSDTARARFRADWEATLTGGVNAGRTAILEDGMEWRAAAFSSKDTEYIEGRQLTYREVAIVYGMDPSVIGMGSETKANAEEYHQQLYQDVLGPWLRDLQDELELQLLPEFDPLMTSTVYLEFNIKEKLKGSFEDEAAALTSAVGVPHMSVNEGRARQNLPRIDDEAFDIPIRPLNVLYGGQAAVNAPTGDPGDPPAMLDPPKDRTKADDRADVPPPPPAAAVGRRDRAVKDHEELFDRYFARQGRAVLSALGSGKAADTEERARWDRELHADLYLLATQVTRESGEIAAAQLRGVYDPAQTFPWLAENARIAAEGINAHTFELVAGANDGAEARAVFEAAGARIGQLALGRSTTLINFARTEAAKQSETADGRPRTKTWVVTNKRSRHPQMNGQTVPANDKFSNGLLWPGDAKDGTAHDVAGCKCLLILSAKDEP